jgi:putative transposase
MKKIFKVSHLTNFFNHIDVFAEDIPARVQTDGPAFYPLAIKAKLGEAFEHKVLLCTANAVQQSYRGINHRYYSRLGFGKLEATQRYYPAFDEVCNCLKPR